VTRRRTMFLVALGTVCVAVGGGGVLLAVAAGVALQQADLFRFWWSFAFGNSLIMLAVFLFLGALRIYDKEE